eukprot:scaffold434_cov186-Pinguiococcus_pyrenoidosus.AAC.141
MEQFWLPLAAMFLSSFLCFAYLADGIQSFLEGVGVPVVHGSEELGDVLGRLEVRAVLQADGEAVKALADEAGVLAAGALLVQAAGDAGHERRVQASREQHSPGHVTHHAAAHGVDEVRAQLAEVDLVAGRLDGGEPAGVPPLHEVVGLAAEVLARGRLVVRGAVVVQGLHLRAEPDGAVGGVAVVQRRDAHLVSDGEELVDLLVVDHEAEHAAQLVHEVHAVLLVQRDDHFAVTARAGHVAEAVLGELVVQRHVVVDLSVGRHDDVPTGGHQGLRATDSHACGLGLFKTLQGI